MVNDPNLPAHLGCSTAQINVLDIGAVSLVEPLYVVQARPAKREAGAGYPLLFRDSSGTRVWVPVRAEDPEFRMDAKGVARDVFGATRRSCEVTTQTRPRLPSPEEVEARSAAPA